MRRIAIIGTIVLTLTAAEATGADNHGLNPEWRAVFPKERAIENVLDRRALVSGVWDIDIDGAARADITLHSRLATALDQYNAKHNTLTLLPQDYYRQYAGTIENGHRLVYINGFHRSGVTARIEEGEAPDFWKRKVVWAIDGGCWYFQAAYDPDRDEVVYLACDIGF